MSKESNKDKVMTKVEREMHDLMELSVERGIDTAMLWTRKNKLELEDRVLNKLFDLVRNGTKDAFMSHVDRTNQRLRAVIDPFLRDDEDPLS